MPGVKAFLKRCREQQGEIEMLTEQRDQLYSTLLPAAIRYDKASVQSSGYDKLLEKMPEISDLDKEISKRIKALRKDEKKAHEIVSKLEDSRHRQVLTLYYLNTPRITWLDVSNKMGYSEESVYGFARDAISILERGGQYGIIQQDNGQRRRRNKKNARRRDTAQRP